MMHLKFLGGALGTVYKGFDGVKRIVASVGDVFEVSEERAKKLVDDFPECFETSSVEEQKKVHADKKAKQTARSGKTEPKKPEGKSKGKSEDDNLPLE